MKILLTFLDISKAFDTINHQLLLDKLNCYGVRGIANNWFKSHLSSRAQYTEYNKNKLSLKCFNVGLPPGSALSPLLYLMFFNDLFY